MPQMGESIAEGTVSRWLKKVGDTVERDEPILEISTDKVDAEIPAPQAGTLVEVAVEEGETVEVGTIVAYLDTEGGAPEAAEDQEEDDGEDEAPSGDAATAVDDEVEAEASTEREEQESAPAAESAGPESAEERLKRRSTPVVRRMAEEHGVDLSRVEGTGHAGRVTKQDLEAWLESGGDDAPEAEPEAAPAPKKAPVQQPSAAPSGSPDDLWKRFYSEVENPEFPVREADRVESMDKIRRLTSDHMVVAKRTAAHVHSFIEIDFTRVDAVRRANRQKWKDQGARVSFTAFVTWALSRILREYPTLNGTASGNNVIYRGNVNLGIAVDLDPGLIVPVIRDADHLSLVGIGKQIMDLAERARNRKLGPQEIQGATFSITNPGVLGTMVGLPVIPKGTSGILGTGAIEKKVVVVEDPETGTDSMAIRKRSIFSLGYDHRIVDGADAARFLARLKEMLENFPDDA
ncbi:MAG: 2-oxo acid dehydrogenase subunit E2 [Gemmatimonadales bacterium]|nr:MAG: 2-oxo acid dehydrogenase subunit E2 [Gemmatimonadales bacterium]